jgi:hypothetical protein
MASFGVSIVYSYFISVLSCIVLIYWAALLLFYKTNQQRFQIFSSIGQQINKLFIKILCIKGLQDLRALLKIPFTYPLRIKAAGISAFFFCMLNAIIVIIVAYFSNKLESQIQNHIDFLKSQPPDGAFIIIQLDMTYNITNSEGIEFGKTLIRALEPVFICTLISMICGFLISMFAILNMFYMFKKIALILAQEPRNSPNLRIIWKRSGHSSIFFVIQFIVNSMFLENLIAFCMFCTTYTLSQHDVHTYIWDYLKTRNWEFWVSLIPLFIG